MMSALLKWPKKKHVKPATEECSDAAKEASLDAAIEHLINRVIESGEHPAKVEALRVAQRRGYTFSELEALAALICADGIAAVGMPKSVGKTHLAPIVESCKRLNDAMKETDEANEKDITKD